MSQYAPQPMPYPMPRRTGSLGCLGVFSIFCLLVFTTIEAGLLLRMDPGWFDRLAFWRPPIIPTETVLVGDNPSLMPPAPAAPPVLPKRPQVPVTHPFALNGAAYDPATGAQVALGDGSVVQFPPGSIRERTEVTVAPCLSLPPAMDTGFAGCAYEIRVGPTEHYKFSEPIRVTFPYHAGAQSVVVAVWEGTNESGRWRQLPSTIDPNSRTVTASVPHASILATLGQIATISLTGPQIAGGIAAGTVGASFFAFTGTGRSLWFSGYRIGSSSHKTKNFKIHYYTSGKEAVPDDAAYLPVRPPNMNSRPGSAPLYVQDLGELLEASRDELYKMGFKIRDTAVMYYDVFLCQLGKDANDTGTSGATYTGGPVFLSNNMHKAGTADTTVDQEMRHTCAHELAHLQQGDWLQAGVISGHRYRSFIEASGAYLGDLTWERLGRPTNVCVNTYGNAGNLLTKTWYSTEDPEYYGYNAFFRHLDQKRTAGQGMSVLLDVARLQDPSWAGLDAVFQGQDKLPDIFREFAENYYHDDLWSGQLLPKLHRGVSLTSAINQHVGFDAGKRGMNFAIVAAPAQGKQQAANLVETATNGSIGPMTAHAAYFWISPIPNDRKPKLVIAAQPTGNRSAGVRLHIAKDKVPAGKSALPTLPLTGSAAGFEEIFFDNQAGRFQTVIENVGAADAPNFVTVILFNRSTLNESGGMKIVRELLLPPSWAKSRRAAETGSRRFEITWEESELRKASGSTFKGYNVYRKLRSAPDTAFTLVKKEVQDEKYADTAPDDGDYIYTVRVLDQFDVESANARYAGDDFVGVWEGELQLVEGDLVEPFIAAMEAGGDKTDQEELNKINAIQDPQEKARRQKEWQETKNVAKEVWKPAKELMRSAELIARIGVPIEVEIKEVGGKYTLTPKKLIYQDMGNAESANLKMQAPTMLKFVDLPEELPPAFLKMHRADAATGTYEIREEGYKFSKQVGDNTYRATWKWVLTKKDAEKVK